MEYLRYYRVNNNWYPPRDSNLSEIVHDIVVAGRSMRFRMADKMPKSYAIYARIEKEYQERTGGRAHIFHHLTDDEYQQVVQELKQILIHDPCNRSWMTYTQT